MWHNDSQLWHYPATTIAGFHLRVLMAHCMAIFSATPRLKCAVLCDAVKIISFAWGFHLCVFWFVRMLLYSPTAAPTRLDWIEGLCLWLFVSFCKTWLCILIHLLITYIFFISSRDIDKQLACCLPVSFLQRLKAITQLVKAIVKACKGAPT